MTSRLVEIWRHPIKSHGREQLDSVKITAGEGVPFDRHWAVAHDAAKLEDGKSWVACTNFSRGSKAPRLMAISAKLDETHKHITLSHPDKPDFSFCPDDLSEQQKFINWVTPISPTNRALPAKVVTIDRIMSDTDYPSISLINLASHRDICAKMGRDLSARRWRGNLLVDGFPAWEEREWIGKTLRIGDAEFEVRENIVRCRATTASTKTGERDADTLSALTENWGHQECGIYLVATKPGTITSNMSVEILP